MDLTPFLPGELVEKIDQHDYVSIDVFDTLIVRGCNHPADIFEIIGKAAKTDHGIAAFKERRIRAEAHAREIGLQRNKLEVTLDEIYDVFARDTGISAKMRDEFKALEIATERAFSVPSVFGTNLIDYLNEKKKRFILASDMYLPKSAITALLDKAGITGHEAFLLSSETGNMKYSGNMFDDIAAHFSAKPSEILHIGDSFHSDFLKAIEKGLVSFHRPALREAFDRREVWNTTALFRGSSPYKMLANGLYLEEFSDSEAIWDYVQGNQDRYWHAFGWLVMGPMLLGLTLWIDRCRRDGKIDKICFLARDGQVVARAFSRLGLNKGIYTSYMAASRRLLTVPNTVFAPQEIVNFYSYLVERSETGEEFVDQIPGGEGIKGRLVSLGLDLSQPIGRIRDRLLDTIGENSGLLTQALAHEREVVAKYLEREFDGDSNVALFDLGWRGSLQASIERLKPDLSTRLTGLYFGTTHVAADILLKGGSQYRAFSMMNGLPDWMREGCQRNTDMIEFLFSADHGSVEQLEMAVDDFVWKMGDLSDTEKQSQAIAAKIQNGALDMIDAVLKTMPVKEMQIYYDKDQILADFYAFLNNPHPNDARMFAGVRVFSGIGDTIGVQLVGRSPKTGLIKDFRKSRWKAGFMRSLGRRDQSVIRILMRLYTNSSLLQRLARAIR